MKLLLPLILIFLTAFSAHASTAIVTNNSSAGNAEDSLTLTFFVTDTIGNFALADSFYVMLFSPTGDSIFAAGYTTASAEIRSLTLGTSGRKGYRWTKEVAEIDGSSPRSGTYSGILIAVDTLDGPSTARLDLGFTFAFILEPSLADRIPIGDTCRDNKPVNLAQISGDQTAADNLESMLDNTGGQTLKLGRLVIDGSYEGAGSLFVRNSHAAGMAMQILGTGTGIDLAGSNGAGLSIAGGQQDIYLHGTGKLHGAISESLLVDMSSFNASLDNDSSLITFLRAGIGGEGGGSCAGSGAYSVLLTVIDTTNDQVIPGAQITIRNIDQSALLALVETDNLGHATVHLDPGDVVFIPSAPNYIFPSTDTVTVTGSMSATLSGYHFDPGQPTAPNLCRLYGFLYGIDGLPEGEATVTASLPSGAVRFNSLVISPFTRATTTNAEGYFALDLIPSDLLDPSGAKYEITITRRDGTILRQRLKIPTTPTWPLQW
ncbi:MAG: hypothetical protein IPH75_13545 [bacterium]|nr:hypothetical protein [bacterium]